MHGIFSYFNLQGRNLNGKNENYCQILKIKNCYPKEKLPHSS